VSITAVVSADVARAEESLTDSEVTTGVRHLLPAGMHQSRFYSYGVVVSRPVKTVYGGGQNAIDTAFQAFQSVWESMGDPPCITAAHVSALAHPDYLLEVEAIAVVPQ
jgi:enamine deaminase RidA (YjgF/YER057c/UK114 family)